MTDKEDAKLTSAYERWELPALMDKDVEKKHREDLEAKKKEILAELNLPTAEEIEQIRKEAYQDGFKEGKEKGFEVGREQGVKAGQTEVDAVVARISHIMRVLTQPIPQKDSKIEETLVRMVLSFCEKIIDRELNVESKVIQSVIEEIIKIINLEQKIKVFLHPNDADLVIEILETKALLDENWQIIKRESISPGGCVVDTTEGHVEATIEKRIADLTEQMYDNLTSLERENPADLYQAEQGYELDSIQSASTKERFSESDCETEEDKKEEQDQASVKAENTQSDEDETLENQDIEFQPPELENAEDITTVSLEDMPYFDENLDASNEDSSRQERKKDNQA